MGRANLPDIREIEVKHMNTISDMLMDIDRGCLANNMIEDCFTYRIVYFVNEGKKRRKYSLESSDRDLRKSLENIDKQCCYSGYNSSKKREMYLFTE